MTSVELRYQTPEGVKTAWAFINKEGIVQSETGLCAMSFALKRERLSQKRIEMVEINTFLDMRQPCPRPEWQALRDDYSADLEVLKTKASCTACDQQSLRIKYIKKLNEQPWD